MIIRYFRNRRRTRAEKWVIFELYGVLGKRYGAREFYTTPQIERAILESERDLEFLPTALLLYSTLQNYESWRIENNQLLGYIELSQNMADKYFKGNLDELKNSKRVHVRFDSSINSDSGTDFGEF